MGNKPILSKSRLAIAGILATSLLFAGCGVSTNSAVEVAPPTTSVESSEAASTPIETPKPKAPPTAEPGKYVATPPKRSEVKRVSKVNGLPPVIKKIDTKKKVVFLTIDDGFITDPKMSAMLAKYGIPVTQFLTNNSVNGSRYSFFKKISKRDGQTIQNHTMSHPNLRTLPFEAQKAQICETNAHYKQQFGASPWMLRPPYGESNEDTRKAAAACGIDYLVNWSATMPKAELRYQNVDSLRSGDIILHHWYPESYKWVEGLIKEVRRQGFKFGALQDYLPEK